MKLTKFKSALILATLITAFAANAQTAANRLPRKAIIGAMNNALQQDTATNATRPFVCKANTMAITIEVSNPSLQDDCPYIITADTLGITLEIFREDEHVFNHFYQYRGSNFAKIMAKVKSAQLMKVKEHGEAIRGGNITVLSFLNKKGAYFKLTDKSGLMNYDGDFDGVITEITRQIPGFNAIISKDYDNPIPLIDGEVKLEKDPIALTALKESAGVLVFKDKVAIDSIPCAGSPIKLSAMWKESDKRSISIVPATQYKPKKKSKDTFWGITYEDVVKTAIPASTSTTSNGVVKAKFTLTPEDGKVYFLYDAAANAAYPFIIIQSDEEDTVG